jgi:hypothetical protein
VHIPNDTVITREFYFRRAELKRVYLIPPSLFEKRTFRKSRNPLTRLRNNRQLNGPSILLENTLRGFQRIEVKVVTNSKMQDPESAPFWIPAGDLSALSPMEIEVLSKSNLTLGPNIDWFNLDIVRVISQLNHVKILIPHNWVMPPVEKVVPKNCQILVWHSGIDTVFWKREPSDLRVREVLVYVKSFNDVENRRVVVEYLQRQQINFTVLEYGLYSKSQFKFILNRVSAAIWIGGTESQGLALIECWSMNVPTLVLRKETWRNADGQTYPASSAPYLIDSVGSFSNSSSFSEDDFRDFFSKLKNFSPREGVQESFSLSACASSLLKLLEL